MLCAATVEQRLGQYVVVQKYCGTPLHFACKDEDGERGHQKIERIFSAAKRAFIDVRLLLSARTCSSSLKEGSTVWTKGAGKGQTSFHILLGNKGTTIDSVQFLCHAWPDVVHMRDSIGQSVLETLVWSDNRDSLSMMKTVVEAARKTTLGSQALLVAEEGSFAVEDLSDEWDGDDVPNEFEQKTILHSVSHHLTHPQPFIALLVQECPQLLKHCESVHCCSLATAPLHSVCRVNLLGNSLQTGTNCAHEFLKHSSVDAVAFALLYVDRLVDSGVELLQNLVDLVREEGGDELQEMAHEICSLLTCKRDSHGNSILHHAPAVSRQPTRKQIMRAKYEVVFDNRIRDDGEEDFDLDMNAEERDRLLSRLAALEERNKDQLKCLFQWYETMSPQSLLAPNIDGWTPMDTLLMNGKLWADDGLDGFVALVPEWPLSKNPYTGLYPFMLAASAPAPDLTTVYSLMRLAPDSVAIED